MNAAIHAVASAPVKQNRITRRRNPARCGAMRTPWRAHRKRETRAANESSRPLARAYSISPAFGRAVSKRARLDEDAEDDDDGREETEFESSDGPRGGAAGVLTEDAAPIGAEVDVETAWSVIRPRQTPVGRNASGDMRRAAPWGRCSSWNWRSGAAWVTVAGDGLHCF
jgi:hypothetical protein